MAELTSQDRAALWADLMLRLSDERSAISITKAELRAVIDAADTWLNDNASSLNSALPLPGRTSLTTTKKALVLMYVIQKRYLAGV